MKIRQLKKGGLVLQDTVRVKDGHRTKVSSVNVEILGTPEEICRKNGVADALAWAKDYAKKKTEEKRLAKEEERKQKRREMEASGQTEGEQQYKFPTGNTVPEDKERLLYCGDIYLKRIYMLLGLRKACAYIKSKRKIKFNLSTAVQSCVYGMLLFPGSKLATSRRSQTLYTIGDDGVDYQHIMRSLPLLREDMLYLQKAVYRNSKSIVSRNTGVIYYDCTNVFFFTDEADGENGLRNYGPGKEHRPKPIAGVGMAVDGDGIPLCLEVYPGNRNEQKTFGTAVADIEGMGISDYVICADAAMSSLSNRAHHSSGGKYILTVLSIKKMDQNEAEWCLSDTGWTVLGQEDTDVTLTEEMKNAEKSETVYAKSRVVLRKLIERKVWKLKAGEKEDDVTPSVYVGKKEIKDGDDLLAKDGTYVGETVRKERTVTRGRNRGVRYVTESTIYIFYEKTVVTFSPKYRHALRSVRNERLKNAEVKVKSKKLAKKNLHASCYIRAEPRTRYGEAAEEIDYKVDYEKARNEEKYDGYYATGTTNLNYTMSQAIHDNKGRWVVESVFRFGKTDLSLRPVFVRKTEHIIAHMVIFFLATVVFMILKKIMNEGQERKFTTDEILQTLREMRLGMVGKTPNDGYSLYTKNTPTMKRLNGIFDFRIDQCWYSAQQLWKIYGIASKEDMEENTMN